MVLVSMLIKELREKASLGTSAVVQIDGQHCTVLMLPDYSIWMLSVEREEPDIMPFLSKACG